MGRDERERKRQRKDARVAGTPPPGSSIKRGGAGEKHGPPNVSNEPPHRSGGSVSRRSEKHRQENYKN